MPGQSEVRCGRKLRPTAPKSSRSLPMPILTRGPRPNCRSSPQAAEKSASTWISPPSNKPFETREPRSSSDAALVVKTKTSLIAETIAIGSELLVGGRVDTNSLFLSEQLAGLGITVRFKSIVGDDKLDIVRAIHLAARRADVVLMTGGLGPTEDDRTREAVACATGRRLRRSQEAFNGMLARLAQWGRVASRAQLRQALIP